MQAMLPMLMSIQVYLDYRELFRPYRVINRRTALKYKVLPNYNGLKSVVKNKAMQRISKKCNMFYTLTG
jgi:hypothetical protein